MTSVVEVSNLTVRLARPGGRVAAVTEASFRVAPGEVFGIVGESGSGKSTLLRAVCGLLPPSADVTGTVRITANGPRRAGASLVFQEPMSALNPVMTVGRQVAEAPRAVGGLSRSAARERAVALMRQVGIPDPERRFHAYPHELSGGLRQRILIAIALSANCAAILCDEPTTALDVTIQDQIIRLFRRLADETGIAFVFVTHDLAVVAQLCDRLAVMYAGRFVEEGRVAEVFAAPRHPYTAGLLAAVPDASRSARRLVAIPGTPPDLARLAPGCAFRPRCRHAAPPCEVGGTALRPLGAGRASACLRADEIHPPIATATTTMLAAHG